MKITENAFEKLIEFHNAPFDLDSWKSIEGECIELESSDFSILVSIANRLKSRKTDEIADDYCKFMNGEPPQNPYTYLSRTYTSLFKGRRYSTKASISSSMPMVEETLENHHSFYYLIQEFKRRKKELHYAEVDMNEISEKVIPLYKNKSLNDVLAYFD